MFRIIFMSALLLTACSKQSKTASSSQAPIPVIVAQAIERDVPLYIDSLGTLKASAILEVRPQVGGMLIEILCKEGQQVKKGTPLFRVDPVASHLKVQEIEAQLAQDHASFESVRKKLERFKSLSVKDVVSRQEWDEIEAQVIISKGKIDCDTAKLQSAKRELENCTVRAQIDGRVGKINAQVGNQVSPSNSLTSLTQLDSLVVDFRISEKECHQLFSNEHKDLALQVCALQKSDKKGKGEISFIDHYFDERTGLLTVLGNVDNAHHHFLPGQPVNVKIPYNTIKNAKLVPSKSIKINQHGHYVFVVENETVAIRQIKIDEEVGSDVVVSEGIKPGEVVVTVGHLRLFPGAKVVITEKEGMVQ